MRLPISLYAETRTVAGVPWVEIFAEVGPTGAQTRHVIASQVVLPPYAPAAVCRVLARLFEEDA